MFHSDAWQHLQVWQKPQVCLQAVVMKTLYEDVTLQKPLSLQKLHELYWSRQGDVTVTSVRSLHQGNLSVDIGVMVFVESFTPGG